MAAVGWAHEGEDWKLTVALAANLVRWFDLRGRWQAWKETHTKALEATRRASDRHREGTTLANMDLLYKQQGRKEKAVALWQEALAKLHPDSPEHRRVAGWV